MSAQSVRGGGLCKKTGCGLAEAVKQPGQEEERHSEEDSDANPGVDRGSTNGN